MRVFLLRHGNAEDFAASGRDDDRALTAQGKQRLERACRAWARLVEGPVVLYASPLRRAQETAAIFAAAIGHGDGVRALPALVPSAAPTLALDVLQQELLAGTRAVALVGHEPHLGSLLGLLLTGSPHASIPFKKGMLAGIDLDTAPTMLGRLLFACGQKQAAQLG